MSRRLWTHEEMILVLNLYLRLPFGKMDSRNPEVIRMADIIGRRPGAVALRLVNFASCDPLLHERGISGMAHAGKRCVDYWNEFVYDRERLLFESERILAEREGTTVEKKYQDVLRSIPQGIAGETKVREVKTRVNQDIFRKIIIANYDGRCALTCIDRYIFLVVNCTAQWVRNKQERLNRKHWHKISNNRKSEYYGQT